MKRKPFRLSTKQKEIVTLFADHSIPPGGPYPMGARDFPIADRVESLADICADEVRMAINISLFLLEWMAWFLGGRFVVWGLFFFLIWPARPRRFSRMNDAEREKLLIRWKEHPAYLLRSLFLSLNSLCQMVYYSDPRVMDAIEYDGYKQGVNAFTPGTPKPSKELLAGQGPGGRS